MRKQTHENLAELFQRFIDVAGAQAAHDDIRAGERFLDACPAPAPSARVIASVKAQMAAAALRRHRITRLVRSSFATAAAVIVLALIHWAGPGPQERAGMSYAAIIPTAIWESDNIAADDLDIVYFTTEIRHLEAQMQALESDRADTPAAGAVEEIEMELLQIEAEFWKG
jgi:hypothetical protein